MTVVMIILIAIGLALILAALVYVGIIGYRLYKTVREATVSLQRPMDEIVRRQAKTAEMMTSIEQRTAAIQATMAAISRNTQTLSYLQAELTGSVDRRVHLTAEPTSSGREEPPNALG